MAVERSAILTEEHWLRVFENEVLNIWTGEWLKFLVWYSSQVLSKWSIQVCRESSG
jgi:hypothetical protein